MNDIPDDIPNVFENVLCWPKKNNSSTKNRQPKIKIPLVATSASW